MTTSIRRITAAAALAASIFAVGAGTASADGTVTYRGQGLDGGALGSVVCGTENGAEADGAYVLFIFTANGAGSATITINGSQYGMTPSGNAFKYVWEGDVADIDSASATYIGTVRGNPQLVISHGCPGDDQPPS